MSITSVVNDLVTSVSVINALKPLPPTISGYSVGGVDDTALDPAGGQTVQINGTGFLAGATITFDGSAVAVVTYVNPNRLTFTSPAKSAGTYTIYAVNPDGGTAIFIPGIIYSVLPTWTTSAGTLGSYYETTSISNTVIATGDAPITYSLFSGSLPAGSTLYANGVITGTAPVDSSSTTYSFTIQATDAQLQDSTRSFSLTINVDAVTWVSPANNTTYTNAVDSAIANVTLSATDAAGYAVSYSANALPTGLSLSGANISGTPTVIADSSTLLTATAATTNRSAVRTINWSITVANDPFFEYNTLLIPGASTTFVDDASTNNFAVSIFGDTKPNSFNPYTPGYYSNYFDGNLDYLSASATTLPVGSANYTIECWFNGSSASKQTIVYWGTGSSNQSMGFTINANGSVFNWWYANDLTTTGVNVLDNAWHHLVATFNGTIRKIYVDGIQRASDNPVGKNTVGTNVAIGYQPGIGGESNYMFGYISNLRVVAGLVYDVSGSTITVPTTPLTAIANTSLLTCQSNRFIDNSTNNFTLTVNGNTSISSFDPFVPNSNYSTYGSGYFDGTGDYLTVPGNSVFAFGTGDFTVEFWIYKAVSGTISILDYSSTGGFGCGITDTQINAYLTVSATYSVSAVVPLASWNHIAFVRSGTTLTTYLNGIAQGTNSTSANFLSPSELNIGRNAGTGTEQINGYISNLRIVKGTAVYTSAFTPPSAPLTAIANTSLLTLQNNQPVNNSVFLDNSTNNFLVTRAGNTTQGTFSPYGGNWSNYFGGQMVSTLSPSSTKFNLTGDFTLEAYVFLTALPGGDWGILDARTAGASPTSWLFGFNGSGKMQYYDGTARVGATTITLNTWHHVSWVRNGSVLRAYLNGVLDYYNGSYGTSAISPGSTAPVIGTKDYGISAAWGTTGYISNLRVVNGTAVYTTSSTTVGTTIFTPSTTPLTPIANTTLLTCADSRFIDDSINNYTITPSSTTISAQRFSPFNPSSVTPTSYSGYFDGSGDYLSVANNTALNLSTGNFTIEGWIWYNDTASYVPTILNKDGVSGSFYPSYSVAIGFTSAYVLNAYVASGGGSPGQEIVSGTALPLRQWVHFAFVRSGTTLTIYQNGVSVVSATQTSAIVDAGRSLNIGYQPSSAGTAYFPGYISNVRIVKGTALYTTTFTPSTTPLTTTSQGATASQVSLLTLQSTTFIDNSVNNLTITANGNSQPTQQNPFGFTSATTNGYTPSTIGGSGYFDGTGDYLTVPSNTAFYLSTGNWTIEAWIYKRTSGKQIIVGQSQNNGAPYAGWTLYVDNSSLIVFEGTNGALIGSPTVAVPLNAWTHVAVVKSSSTVTIYQNGVSVNSGGAPSVTDYNTVLAIGNYSSYVSGADWNGYISDLRIVKGTAIYSSNFVPPAAPILSVQNTSLLTNMTSAGVYDAAMMNNMETVGDAKLSTAVSKFGGSSMSFDGTGDYLLIPSTQFQNFAFGTGDFTIECWLYQTAFSADMVIAASFFGWATSVNFYFATRAGTPNILIFRGGDSVPITLNGNTGITTSTWTHVAVCRASGVTRMFVGGVAQTATHTGSVNLSSTIQPVGIGAANNGSEPMNGYLDDLRITKGYARYTSTFTPPTTAFPVY